MTNKKLEKLLLVEDNPQYRVAAEEALKGRNYSVATNYDEAREQLSQADAVITDVFFQQNKSGTNPELQARAIEAIKYGLVKNYVEKMSTRVEEESGMVTDERLKKIFEKIGYHQIGCSDTHNEAGYMTEAVSRYVAEFKESAAEKLEEAVNDILGVASKGVIGKLFNPLEEYMKKSPENQPLGYLVAEEAEKLRKPFVLVTSLRHAESCLMPVLRSAKAREWNMLEGGDGSKDSPEYWLKAYERLKGGKE